MNQAVKILVIVGCLVLGAAGCKCQCKDAAVTNSTAAPGSKQFESSVDFSYTAGAVSGSACQVR